MATEGNRHERTVCHVTPDASGQSWVVSQEHGDFNREFDRQEDAIDIAKLKAKLDEFSQVKVHRRDGTSRN